MKEGWEYKKLGEICEVFCDGDWIESKDQSDNGIRLIQTGNVGNGEYKDKAEKSKYISEETFKELNCTEIFPGDVLVSRLPDPIGRACVIPDIKARMITAVDCSIIRFKDIKYSKLFVYYTQSGEYARNIEKYTTGATRKRISRSNLGLVCVPIPSIEDQLQIISELDLLSGVIEKQKAQLEELDKLAQSIFYDMFGDPVTNEKNWDVKKLSEVSKEKLSYGSGASAIPYDGELRYIRITDIKDNGELNEDVVSPNQIDEKYILREGDILFARSGATVGKTYRHREEYGKCLYAGYLIRLVPNIEMVMPTYVFGYTKTSYYLEFVRNAQNAVAQPNINAKQYGHLLICVPPLSLQQEFAAKVEAIEAMKAKVSQSLKEAETLFNSRMDYYFN